MRSRHRYPEYEAKVTAPDDARLVKSGHCVVGYVRNEKATRSPLSGLQGKAARRLKFLAALAALHSRHGVFLGDPASWLTIVVDCLAFLHGVGSWQLNANFIERYLPTTDLSRLTDDMIGAALAAPRERRRLLSEAEAGMRVHLTSSDLAELQAVGVVTTMHPIDENDDERALRRACRQRTLAAARQKKLRLLRKINSAKTVTANVATILQSTVTPHLSDSRKRYELIATFGKEPERVVAAVAAGVWLPGDIAAKCGLPITTVRPLLSRLVRQGIIVRLARGRYAPAKAQQAPQPIRHINESISIISENIRLMTARIAAATQPLTIGLKQVNPANPTQEHCHVAAKTS